MSVQLNNQFSYLNHKFTEAILNKIFYLLLGEITNVSLRMEEHEHL